MKLEPLIIMLLPAAVFPVIGCNDSDQAANQKKELVVLCGSSFVPPSEKLIEQFKRQTAVEVITSSAGSEDFLPLVKAGKKGDVLITHDPYLDYVKEADAYFDHAEVGFVAPVLAVQPGNPRQIKSIEDLTRPGLKVALTDPQYSTCGEMVFALLEKKGIKDEVLANVENRLTKGHSNLGNLMKTEAVDAVIMWNGVAHNFSDSLEIVKTPYEYEETIRVHVIGLNYTGHQEMLEKFMAFIKEHGPATFASFGYVK